MDESADRNDGLMLAATVTAVAPLPAAAAAATLTDEELVKAVREGDEGAFEQLFERHRRRVARVAGRFFKRREQIEEIVQESFVKAYFALPSYTGAHEASFVAWLTRITINVAYDELRRARRHPESMFSDLSDDESAWLNSHSTTEKQTADVASTIVVRDLADKLLARLEPEDRFVLTLLNGEELPVAEVAEITGWSISKVKVRAHRARLRLRRVLSNVL